MPIVTLVVVLIVIGVLLWLVNTMIPMDDKIKQIINVVVIIATVLWVLSIFLGGSFGSLGGCGAGLGLRHPLL